MSGKDMGLIEQARNVHFTDWHLISGLIKKAESAEAKEALRGIRAAKHHLEEYYAFIS